MSETEDTRPKILVSAASKHGSTAEIAERIGETLASHGLEVTVAEPDGVTSLEGYQAVVLGSGVYAGHWLKDAKQLADRVGAAGSPPLVWLFSSGPLGDPPKPEEDPVDVAPIVEVTSARDHRVFSGKIDKASLSFGERAIMIAVRAPEGDFRDWAEISAWADQIADSIDSELSSRAG